MNRVLIDTDILSYYLKGDKIVVENFKNYIKEYDLIEISIITYYEIMSGLLYKDAYNQIEIFESFVADNYVITLTEQSCKISGEIYSKLKREGKIVDDIDILIAGIAIENELTLITNNEKHFERIPGLKIENWKKHVL